MVLSLCAIILLFSLLALLVVPARFYKKNSLLMQKFCLRMIFVEKFRKLYTLGLLMALIMAHYGAHVIMPNEPGVLISSVLCLIFFNFRWTERILKLVQNDTKIYSAMGLLCLVLLDTPHLFSFSFFVGFILLAATFYPSKAIMKRIEDDAFVEGLLKHRETIVKHYF